jgi:predicted DNA-binding protein (MmcQ/YjbR family)
MATPRKPRAAPARSRSRKQGKARALTRTGGSPRRGEDPTLVRLRAICLALPGTKETITWGEPHFRVGEKIFAGWGAKDGRPSCGFKLEREHAAALIDQDPRFRRAPYVGQHGWVEVDVGGEVDWPALEALVGESYALIAPGAGKTVRAKEAGRAGAVGSTNRGRRGS